MLLGIDFGTTRTLVAAADRGNYPVVGFTDEVGDASDHFPSAVALVDGELVFGVDAVVAARQGAPSIRSFKRVLGAPTVNADTPLAFGDVEVPLLEVMTGYFAALRRALESGSSIAGELDEGLQPAVVSVPARAHSAQRFLTLEAYRRAGFKVTAMINEPSAAGFEYTHRQARTVTSRRNQVVVYDLGGGTFDSSRVQVEGVRHEVLGTLGLGSLGGDDFDVVLAERALAAAGTDRDALTLPAYRALLEECREAKERVAPQSRRIVVEVGGQPVNVTVEDFYASAAPLIQATLDVMAPLLQDDPEIVASTAGIYLVGGGSSLPLVARMLRERFGRRVHRSPHPAASTAIGLAIAGDADAGYSLTERLSRGFGVFRELLGGNAVGFDQILTRDAALDPASPVVVTRRYRPAHNLGWFRFVEYTSVDSHGVPSGDLIPFAEVRFPYDPALQHGGSLDDVPVERRHEGSLIEETYTIDPHGIIEVQIADLDTGYRQVHALHA